MRPVLISFLLPLTAMLIPLCATAQSVAEGQALFETHCATCHGLDGAGGGPMSGVLMIRPSNLRKLTERHDGQFPLIRVIERIDGRDPLVAHGSPMPVYGDFFETMQQVAVKTDAGQPILTSQPIVDLVAYLRGLQD